MSKVEQIEAEIAKLPPQEFRQVSQWMREYEAELWDQEMERDARPGGPLDKLAQQARKGIAAKRKGRANRYDYSDLTGRLQWRGDAVAEQRRLRNEW